MHDDSPKILIIGYGNPGRLDDGLGPAFAEALERLALPGVTVESNYQLTVEDADTISAYDIVIFADATVEGDRPFTCGRIPCGRDRQGGAVCYTSHHLMPADVIELAGQLFGRQPTSYILAIRGYEFNEFGEWLSPGARANLEQAVAFVSAAIRLKSARASADVDPFTTQETTSSQGVQICKTANM